MSVDQLSCPLTVKQYGLLFEIHLAKIELTGPPLPQIVKSDCLTTFLLNHIHQAIMRSISKMSLPTCSTKIK